METIQSIFDTTEIACPACDHHGWSAAGQVKDYTVSGEWFEIRECIHCHLRMTFPQPPDSKIGDYYASNDYVSHTDTKKGLVNKVYHKARKFMMQRKWHWVTSASGLNTGRLLDVGAGTGHFAKFMKDHGWEVTALEPDSKARKVGHEKLGISIQPLEDLASLQPQSFDVITLWHVLEHVHDVNGYLDQFRSLLNENGTLIIAVPNHTSRDAQQYGSFWAAYDVPRHLWHFSPASMRLLLQKHGFWLSKKITMPLDGFYVSMLSEKYKRNGLAGPAMAFISGLKTIMASRKDVNKASSIIYISKVKSKP